MTNPKFVLLAAGLTLAAYNDTFLLVSYLVRNKRSIDSPPILPIIGTLCTIVGLVLGGPVWAGLLALFGDATNWLVARSLIQEWGTSRWTLTDDLRAHNDERKVRLTLHGAGPSVRFVLVSEWPHRKLKISQTGNGAKTMDGYLLEVTKKRTLHLVSRASGYDLIDPDGDLNGWQLAR